MSLPTYRLVPEIRLQLDADGSRVLARSDPRAGALGAGRRGVAVTVDDGAPLDLGDVAAQAIWVRS